MIVHLVLRRINKIILINLFSQNSFLNLQYFHLLSESVTVGSFTCLLIPVS